MVTKLSNNLRGKNETRFKKASKKGFFDWRPKHKHPTYYNFS